MKQGMCGIPVEENSFWGKWLTLQNELFKRCMTITDQYHDAEDLLSEVMYKAYLKGPSDEKSLKHFENWLGKLAKNMAIDIKRHNQKIVHTEDIELLLQDKSLQYSRSPRQDLIYEEQLHTVNEIIKDVSPNYRHIVKSYFVDHYSYEDIINTYSMNIEYVRKIVSLAREKISTCLNSYGSGEWSDQSMPEPEIIMEGENIYDHSFMIGTPQDFHFCTIFTDVLPGRLEQKEKSYRDYLEKTPNSGAKRLSLAKNLLSQGKLMDAEKQLDFLLSDNYHDNEVFEYKLLISKLFGKENDLQYISNLAVKEIPKPPALIKALEMQYNAGKKCARDFYRIHLNNNPEDINSRVEYIKLLDEMELYKEAFTECKVIQKLSPNNLKVLPYIISYKIQFEGLNSTSKYVKNCFNSNKDSISVSIYYLHFLIREYNKFHEDQNIQLILNRLRKKYSWHPDFALAKALLSVKKEKNRAKRAKTLKRRCADYPGCSVSKHYSKFFGKEKIYDLPELTPSIRQHLKIVKSIHNSFSSSKSEVKYAAK